MAIPVESSLSQACIAIREFLAAELKTEGADHDPNVYLGAPKNSFESYKDTEDDWINLFFYRFEPFEFHADVLSGETAWLRVHCLITPVAKKLAIPGGVGNDAVSEGEQDLRLLGEVMRVFHEYPQNVLGENDQKFHFQAIFEPLTMESINQIWSTQGSEIAYRPSVAYEFALAAVIPRKKAKQALLVGATGFRADGNMDHAEDVLAGDDYSAIVQTPLVATVHVNSKQQGWVPASSFIYAESCAQSLIFGAQDGALFQSVIKNKNSGAIETIGTEISILHVWLAGKINQTVSLRWEIWDSTAGWQKPVDASTATFIIQSDTIDPEHVPDVSDAAVASIDLPLSAAGQAILYAEYSYQRSSDKARLTVRSNPLMLTVYELPA